ncbi:MAG: MerR family transcriptional regulator [Comamonas sp.]|jgi:DNA-binding transcriptional MerR regulator|nr:MerR family transcriptional regulator [Comamonas sp.]
MEPPLSIEEAAQRTGLSAHTLRYYERIGLIAAVTRAAGGQRRYAAADLAWLAFLTRLRTTRMPIQKMRLFAQLRSSGDATVPARREMLQTHLAEVQADISAMQQAAQALQDKIAHYQALEDAASAPPPNNTRPKKESNHG